MEWYDHSDVERHGPNLGLETIRWSRLDQQVVSAWDQDMVSTAMATLALRAAWRSAKAAKILQASLLGSQPQGGEPSLGSTQPTG